MNKKSLILLSGAARGARVRAGANHGADGRCSGRVGARAAARPGLHRQHQPHQQLQVPRPGSGHRQGLVAGGAGRLRLDRERLLRRQLELEHRLDLAERHQFQHRDGLLRRLSRARSSRTWATTSASCSTTTRSAIRKSTPTRPSCTARFRGRGCRSSTRTPCRPTTSASARRSCSRRKARAATCRGRRAATPATSTSRPTYPVIDNLTINGHLGYTRYSRAICATPRTPTAGHLPNYSATTRSAPPTTSASSPASRLAGAIVGANKKGFYGERQQGALHRHAQQDDVTPKHGSGP